MEINYDEFECIVGYGIGQYYGKVKDKLKEIVNLDYLYDRKWEDSEEVEYDGIPIIKAKDFYNLKNPLVIIMSETPWIVGSISRDLADTGFCIIRINDVVKTEIVLTGKDLKKMYPNELYTDAQKNEIRFDQTISDNLTVMFRGKNSKLEIGSNVAVHKLTIRFGNNGYCSIGKNTEIIGAYFNVSEAKVEIGKDCLFSTEIRLRTHDSHHIFDNKTHKRINYAEDIIIENQVWIGNRVTILGGSKIGTGTVVGCHAVTTSDYGDHKVIAGVPAKIIREDIFWSRDNTDFYNRDYFEECISKDALKYI